MCSDGLIVPVFWSKAQSISSKDRGEMFPCLLKSETSAVLCISACPQKTSECLNLKKKIAKAIDHTRFFPAFRAGAKETYQQYSQHKPVTPLRFQMSHHVTVDIALRGTMLHHGPHRKMQRVKQVLNERTQ